MNSNKKILIIAPYKFGELVDCVYWKHHLEACKYEVYYFGYSSTATNNIDFFGIKHTKHKSINLFRFYIQLFNLIKTNDFSDIIFCYWEFCFILPLYFPKLNIVLDVRTSSVSKSRIKRIFFNFRIWFSSLFFNKISVVSSGVGNLLRLNHFSILSLGAIFSPSYEPLKGDFNLLYVGILDGRNIEETIIGYKFFLTKSGINNSKFNIVGGGSEMYIKRLENLIKKNHLSDHVYLRGYVAHSDLFEFLKISHVGVSFIPITSYYNFQPSTKNYEYLLAGLPVIATKTYENSKLISKKNGILIDDNAVSFSSGVYEVFKNYSCFDRAEIIKSAEKFNWFYIIHNQLIPLLS
ncbi:MAG: glycosyltransferase [Cytophagales bacterium]|nr:glycosyltransferase [Cytophagales bacterium]